MELTEREKIALKCIDHMSEMTFQEFLAKVPRRVQARIENGTSKWQDVLPKWYIRFEEV